MRPCIYVQRLFCTLAPDKFGNFSLSLYTVRAYHNFIALFALLLHFLQNPCRLSLILMSF